MITKEFTFDSLQLLYHNKVIPRLTPVQRLVNQAHNCKMDHKPEGKSRDFIKTGEETCHVFKASRLVAFTLNQRSTPMKNLKNDRGK